MSGTLHDLLLQNRTSLEDGVISRLRSSGAPHYREMDDALLRTRSERLVAHFLKSIAEKPGVFLSYIDDIAAERISESVFLNEIQIVLRILEEGAWKIVVEFVPLAEQVRCLSRITGTIGLAKDKIANLYLRYLEKAELRAATLQNHLDELARGTDSAPIEEDDLPDGMNVNVGRVGRRMNHNQKVGSRLASRSERRRQ